MDHSPSVAGMNQIQLLLPVVIFQLGMTSPTVEVADEAARGNPEESCDRYYSHDDVVPQESEDFIDVDVFDDIPESLNHILNCLLANSLVAEALNARRSIG